ncbi:hypothetical protein PN462_02930 [Spirulina sp. CS-785/01]|uniref:hypothetical protein n=1 Tax=Spirulina sp. CS-785/01 TaxID=3021716 RepID=UPI00232DB873|nr:hypothetical protein [Spirulina sp. CS-785/01]MDB9312041.1 hypothetical protein [Spirulina sp. CS-785/01]
MWTQLSLRCLSLSFACVVVGCSPASVEVTELKHYPIQTLEGVIAETAIEFDADTSYDNNGALKITAEQPMTVPLYETGDLEIENTRIFYQARLKTQAVQGKVYLEMLCHFPEKGEYFSRALDSPVTNTQDWTTQETPFILRTGENPDNIKLNVVIEGTGTVWVDDIHLTMQE